MIEGSFKVAILKLPLADLILELRRVELMSKRIRGVLALEKLEGGRQIRLRARLRRDKEEASYFKSINRSSAS